MEEDNRPKLKPGTYFDGSRIPERQVCENLGAKYMFLLTDLAPRKEAHQKRPKAHRGVSPDRARPGQPGRCLLHCKAGLHRTGLLTAVYRMEVTVESEAAPGGNEDNGFGEFSNCIRTTCTLGSYFSILSGQTGNQGTK